MRLKLIYLTLLSFTLFSACDSESTENGAEETTNGDVTLNTQMEKGSYGLGVNIGNNFKSAGLDSVNLDLMMTAINDVLQGNELKMSETEAQNALQGIIAQAQQQQAQAGSQAGQQFLQQNMQREGVQVTESGLQYEVVEEGNGASPDADDQVTVHYTGKLIDGTVFDSSVERGEPATFPVNGVIPGWTEALQMMKEGAKYTLYIPSNLAYGQQGSPPKIGPNETLIFDVELLEVSEQEGGAQQMPQQ